MLLFALLRAIYKMRDICFLGIKVQGMYCGKHVFKVEFFRPEKNQYSAPVTIYAPY